MLQFPNVKVGLVVGASVHQVLVRCDPPQIRVVIVEWIAVNVVSLCLTFQWRRMKCLHHKMVYIVLRLSPVIVKGDLKTSTRTS